MTLIEFIQSERGNASRLADAVGISMSYLSQMAAGTVAISPRRAVQIEQASAGVVTRKDTHPSDWREIWPELAVEGAAA